MKFRRGAFIQKTLLGATLTAAASGCTGQIPGSFRAAQQDEVFASQLAVNTEVDLLWVVDNSSSMDVAQEKLRNGFSAFAAKYMQPSWDIRVAVITTDTYLANGAFASYLNSTVPGTVGWASPQVNSRLASWVNPSWNPSLVNTSTGKFDSGVKFKELVPAWQGNYSLLLPGLHDGPISGLCFEGMPYFLNGATQCAVRDNPGANTGSANCLNPNTGAGETSETQCVNTIQNDTIHSGKAIISTMPSSQLDETGLTAWTQQLAKDFMINVSTGTTGHGSERGFGSLLQMVQDNESAPSRFFRSGSVRAIIFVTDEDDQTLNIEASVPSDFTPYTHYRCDQASLVAMNPSANITGASGFCCDTPGNNCRFGSEGISCSSKTVDGHTYTLSVCPVESSLKPVTEVKSSLDSFFLGLDGADATKPGYMVITITPLTGVAIQNLQSARNADDTAAGGFHTVATDRGDRYIELGNQVGNGSLSFNMADNDYSPILDSIGMAIVTKMGTFTLARAPTAQEDMIVKVVHADGSSTVIPSSDYVISGKDIIIDSDVVLGFASTDRISINYQPKNIL